MSAWALVSPKKNYESAIADEMVGTVCVAERDGDKVVVVRCSDHMKTIDVWKHPSFTIESNGDVMRATGEQRKAHLGGGNICGGQDKKQVQRAYNTLVTQAPTKVAEEEMPDAGPQVTRSVKALLKAVVNAEYTV